MPSNPPSAAIDTLNDDALRDIFAINADIFTQDDCLRTARLTSHVCRRWRDVMIETPSLWAKLFDMDEISLMKNANWRNELVRRSGKALLWITADTPLYVECDDDGGQEPFRMAIKHFFRELITKNWHRIEKLEISYGSGFEPTHCMMRSPAPLLKHIEAAASLQPTEYGQDTTRTAPLFADHAPLLRRIYLSREFVDQRALWLRHLCSMTLDNTYSLSDALAVLSATCTLQELTISHIAAGQGNTTHPIISLSRLQNLSYSVNDCSTAVTLLNHLAIPADCSLSIYCGKYSSSAYEYQKPFILSTINTFMRHAACAFQSLTFNRIGLNYRPKSYISWECKSNSPVERVLEIIIPLSGNSDNSILEFFLTKLLRLDLTSVTYLIITAHGQSMSHFASFFSHLPSLDTICADSRTISDLADFQNSVNSNATETPSSIFPMLKAIKLFYQYSAPQGSSSFNKITGAFLRSRLQAGVPINTLDMTHIPPLGTPPDLQALKEAKCQTVLYRLSSCEEVTEYTFGTKTEKIHQCSLEYYKPRL